MIPTGGQGVQASARTSEELFGQDHMRDPHRTWRRLRLQGTEVLWHEGLSAWLILSDRLGREALQRDELSAKSYEQFRPSPLALPTSFELDREQNRRVRKAAWSCMRSGALPEDAVRRLCTAVADTVEWSTTVEVVSQYADPLGHALTQAWTGLDSRACSEVVGYLRIAADDTDPTRRQAAGQLATELLLQRVRQAREAPGGDLLSRLTDAWDAHQADESDLVAFLGPMLFSLVRGQATRLLTHALLGISGYVESHEVIAAEGLPAGRRAAMEAARWEPISQVAPRRARQPLQLGPVHIDTGALVLVVLTAACRDPDLHADPDVFRLDRTERSLAFGANLHGCLGRDLAVEVCAAALTELIAERDLRFSPHPCDPPKFMIELGRSCIRLPLRTARRTVVDPSTPQRR